MPRKKLIEVALPLEAINRASSREKSIRHGHPSTLHLWWARRPLAAARAVIFAQTADDPSEYVEELLADPKKRAAAERALSEGASFASLEEAAADAERRRLFALVEELVQWENTTNEDVLGRARSEMRRSWRRARRGREGEAAFESEEPPAFHDPFAGGGALPLEAQRLGLEAHASDLNPVAALINKAMIEIPPKFAGRPPANPEARREARGEAGPLGRRWKGAQGLAEDVRHYGEWMREEAGRRIGRLYPKVEITEETVRRRPDLAKYEGRALTPIAWLWARTVRSPNPAFADAEVPLCSTFVLSAKKGKEAYVEPVVEGGGYRFEAKAGAPEDMEAAKRGTKLARGANFRCLLSDAIIDDPYIKAESMAGRMGARLMAIVAEGDRERVYLSPTREHEEIARSAKPSWRPDQLMNRDTSNLVSGRGYGFFTWADLFAPRQLAALGTFSELAKEAVERVERDYRKREEENAARNAGFQPASGLSGRDGHDGENRAVRAIAPPPPPLERESPDRGARASSDADDLPLREGGAGARAYAEAVGVYLAFAVSKISNVGSSITTWMNDRGAFRETFARQAIPMVWDYAEANPLANAGGNLKTVLSKISMVINEFPALKTGSVRQFNAENQTMSTNKIVSTDPPYYDNIGYADLSDFFYVWLRRSLRSIFPALFSTLAAPKAEELVATPYRHGSKDKAEAFFLGGMTEAMRRLADQAHPAYPVTIYYAFKQAEKKSDAGATSTGWETFLAAVIRSGFSVTGTWPMRTEGPGRIIAKGTNALASSIVLVCRRRAKDARVAARREFVVALREELPRALARMQSGNIAPVDLAQAAIGPGMGVFSRYARVVDAAGEPVSVREALQLINETLDETMKEQEGDFDADSRWALAWFAQHGFEEGEYGVAETLSKAKNTSIAGVVDGGILASKAGKVRLLRPEELSEGWDAASDARLSVWEATHRIARTLETGGEMAAARMVRSLSGMGGLAERARDMAYRLYALCERKKRAAEALSYNGLVQSWPEIARLARSDEIAEQTGLFEGG